MSFCQKCGTQNAEGAGFCTKCGTSLTGGGTSAQPGKSWTTAFLLCWFFGFLGIHRFYVGKTGSGIAQLLTLGGLGIWVFVDWVMLLAQTFTDKNGNKITRKSGEGLKVGIAMAVVVVAVVLIAVMAGGSGGSGDVRESLRTSSGTQDAPAEEPLAEVGDTLKTSTLNLIVTNIRTRARVGEEYFESTPSEGATYVTVQYKYKNVSSKALGAFSRPDISLVDPNGNKYDADVSASASFATEVDDNEKVMSDLNPGISVTSSTVFEVAEDMIKQPGWYLLVEMGGESFKVNVNRKGQPASSASSPSTETSTAATDKGLVTETGTFKSWEFGEDVGFVSVTNSKGKEYSFMIVEDFEGSSAFRDDKNVGKKVKFSWKRAKVMTPGGEDEIDKLVSMSLVQ